MKTLGTASLSFSALCQTSEQSTFKRQSRISEEWGITRSAFGKHLEKAVSKGLVKRADKRHRFGSVIWNLTKAGREAYRRKPYGILPLWACLSRSLNWADKAFLSLWFAEVAKRRAEAMFAGNFDDLDGEIDKELKRLCGKKPISLSERAIHEAGVLSRDSARQARARLSELGVFTVVPRDGDSHELSPVWEFQIECQQ